jgi:hypothetical protein
VVGILRARLVAPVPSYTPEQAVGKEQLIGCRENASESIIIQGELVATSLGVDKRFEDAFRLSVVAIRGNMRANQLGGIMVAVTRLTVL